MGIVLKNNAHTVLSADMSSLDTTIYVSDTSSFPALGVGEYFYCTVESTTGTYEIVKVTQVNAASFTAVRGQETTIAVPFSAGARVELRVTVQSLEDHFSNAATDEAEAAIAAAIGVTVQGYDADTAKTDLAQTWALLQTFSTTPVVPDEAYGSGWNGVFQVPTKNAIFDKIDAIDTTLSGLGSTISLRGTWDASAGTFPGSGTAKAGYSYIVSIGGTVDSTVFSVGDRVIAITDNASTTTYASNWFKADYTDAVSSVAGKTGAITIQVADITDMTANGRSLVSAADYSAMRTLLGLVIGTNVQAYDADLTTWAGITPAAGISTFLTTPSSANLIAAVTGETGTGALVFATSPTLVTPLLGTPTSGTLTNCTGLPVAGITASTSTALGVGSIELGHASDTSIARVSAGVASIEGVNIVTTSSTDTLTNKTLTSPTVNGGTSSSRIQLSSETTGTLTSASANKKILATGSITLPNSVFSAQDAIVIEGNGTARTITRGSGVTMYIAGVDSATGTLTANGVMGVHWRTASICILTGNIS